jgi:hypothetical protein
LLARALVVLRRQRGPHSAVDGDPSLLTCACCAFGLAVADRLKGRGAFVFGVQHSKALLSFEPSVTLLLHHTTVQPHLKESVTFKPLSERGSRCTRDSKLGQYLHVVDVTAVATVQRSLAGVPITCVLSN